MPTLICYDITDNALRQRVAQKILEFGLDRVNRSVFLGAPRDKDLRKLETLLRELLAGKRSSPDDSLLILPVHAHQIHEMKVYGRQDWAPEELTGEIHTLIF
jgi:CRISPR-associated endonuclease Cas2